MRDEKGSTTSVLTNIAYYSETDHNKIVQSLRTVFLLDTQNELQKEKSRISQEFISAGMFHSTVHASRLLEAEFKHNKRLFDRIIETIEKDYPHISLYEFKGELFKIVEEEFQKISPDLAILQMLGGEIIQSYIKRIMDEKENRKSVIESKCELARKKHRHIIQFKKNWIQRNKILVSAVTTIMVAIITALGNFFLKKNDPAKIENQNSGQQTNISDAKIDSYVQNYGISSDEYANAQKRLGKTEYELEKTRIEKQELENIVTAYKQEDKQIRAKLEKAENQEKLKIIVKIYQARDKGIIDNDKASALSDMVNKALWEDLKSFLQNRNITIDQNNRSLFVSGIFEIQEPLRGRERYSFGTHYRVSQDGDKLYEISNATN